MLGVCVPYQSRAVYLRGREPVYFRALSVRNIYESKYYLGDLSYGQCLFKLYELT